MHPIEHLINYSFKNESLLQQALTHRSFSGIHNERLEFIGDSVLNCVIAELLYHRYPQEREGSLSRVRAQLVNEQCLSTLSKQLTGFSSHLKLGKAELGTGKTPNPIQASILADAMEALIGAVFLDGGFQAARNVIEQLYSSLLKEAIARTQRKDAKTQLQEWLQKRQLERPTYSTIEETGSAHEREFTVRCHVPSHHLFTDATARSRRLAEQYAAHAACLKLDAEMTNQLIPLSELS